MKMILEKLAPLGSVISAAACPTCFPAIAGIGAAFGLGFFTRYEKEALVVMQIFIALSIFFAFLSYRRTGNKFSLSVAILSGVLMFFSWYVYYHPVLFYTGMAGLIVSASWNFWLERKISFCKTNRSPASANNGSLAKKAHV